MNNELKIQNIKNSYLDIFLVIFVSILPIALITGPFIIDLIVSLSSLIFLYFLFKKKKINFLNNRLFFFFIFWCVYLILRSLFSDNIILSLEASLFYFRFGIFSFLILYLLNNYPFFLKYFFYSFIFVFYLLVLDGFIQYFVGYNIIGIEYTSNRVSSFFGEEKILGSFISRTYPLIIALTLMLDFQKKIKILIIVSSFIFSDTLIYLSGERTAFFYMIFSSILFILLLNEFKKIRILTFFISFLLIFFISISSPEIKSRMIDKTLIQTNLLQEGDNLIFDKDNPFSIHFFSIQHQVIYTSAIRIFKDNIFFGIGPKMFRETCKQDKYQVKTSLDHSINGCQTSPHNYYIQLLAETGLIGSIPIFFLFFVITLLFFKQISNKILKKTKYLNDIQISLLIAIYISLWPLAPTGNFFNNYISIIHYLPLGFLIYSFQNKNSLIKQ